ncbi:protein tyrosine kinase domain-containing protein [Ditylenchus destructor]|nr:protein tyrosine kinase domain-containing protein [Ditylenchus destructor]
MIPMDSFILLHFPFDQHSKIHIKSGISIHEAISSILRKRNIPSELCTVCVDADSRSQQVDMDGDLYSLSTQLTRQELWVHVESMELLKSIHHDFVKASWSMSITDCGVCNRFIAVKSAYCCDRCKFVFHKKCWSGVPYLCDWEINPKQVVIMEQIGGGSYGTVFKADYLGPVAVKKLNLTNPSISLLLAFKNEATVLKKAQHQNVLNFLGVMREPEWAIVTQWCQGASLYRRIHATEPMTEFNIYTIVKICQEITHGMNYLHSKNIIHRDLKSSNIFFTDDSVVKIGDFGLATVKTRWNQHNGAPDKNPTGSVLWMAPEVIKTNTYSTLSDVYSFGICLYELLTASLPYNQVIRQDRDRVLFMVGSGLLKPDFENLRADTPNALRNLLELCISYETKHRPEFFDILSKLG